jgi:hypothetical protein
MIFRIWYTNVRSKMASTAPQYAAARQTRSDTMIASFALIFVAFAACQAALTVKFADFLSPIADANRTSGSTGTVVGAKLA